jgi:serine/threonine protein phosphatase 1
MSLVIFPDTHGHLDMLISLMEYIESVYGKEYTYAFLGDYLDRGPKIRELLNFCINLQKDGHIFICGNHEFTLRQAIAEYIGQSFWTSKWFNQYEDNTLESFGLSQYDYFGNNERQSSIDLGLEMTFEEIGFLKSLPLYWENDDFILIHSMLVATETWEYQRKQLDDWDMAREEIPPQLRVRTLSLPFGIQKYVVSGHDPVNKPIVMKNRISFDLGVDCNRTLAAYITDLNLFVTLCKNEIREIPMTPSR